jgi:hypothetical protein
MVAERLRPGVNVSKLARHCGVNRGLLLTWRRFSCPFALRMCPRRGYHLTATTFSKQLFLLRLLRKIYKSSAAGNLAKEWPGGRSRGDPRCGQPISYLNDACPIMRDDSRLSAFDTTIAQGHGASLGWA